MKSVTNIRKENHVPLIVEDYPKDYKGYPFITLIKYRDQELLVVVDNITTKTITAYVTDRCATAGIDEKIFIELVSDWYKNHSDLYPLSIYFAKHDVVNLMSKILQTYTIDFITRIIGILPKYEVVAVENIKRRKRRIIDSAIPINDLVNF